MILFSPISIITGIEERKMSGLRYDTLHSESKNSEVQNLHLI